jgi:hypothetical protein
MLRAMRTTINLPDGLVQQAKQRAAAEGRTLTSLIAEGLRSVLERGHPAESSEPLPAFGDPDGTALVDLQDREALWAALDADGPR